MTLYSPVTNALALLDVPANALSKLCGFWSSGSLMRPAKAAQPEMEINKRIAILNNPSAFCSRKPHLRKTPCIMSANVTQAMPMPR